MVFCHFLWLIKVHENCLCRICKQNYMFQDRAFFIFLDNFPLYSIDIWEFLYTNQISLSLFFILQNALETQNCSNSDDSQCTFHSCSRSNKSFPFSGPHSNLQQKNIIKNRDTKKKKKMKLFKTLLIVNKSIEFPPIAFVFCSRFWFICNIVKWKNNFSLSSQPIFCLA